MEDAWKQYGDLSLRQEDLDRFWSKVDRRGPDECWEWQGYRYRKGYGSFTVNGRRMTASRVALTLKLGRPIDAGKLACHTCDNPPCCNPAHLWEGTNQENLADASRKGRISHGVKTHCKYGHPFAGDNLLLASQGAHRLCRICRRARDKSWRSRAGLRAEASLSRPVEAQ